MNVKQARYIVTIAECGTVTAAAKLLYVSQPSLSQMLRQVEEELGLPIFDRSVSPFRLTYAGEAYVQTAKQMLSLSEQLDNQIREIKQDHSGRLRLGISVSRAMQVLPKVVSVFTKKYPNVPLELTERGSADLEDLLSSGEIDLALAAIESTSPKFTYELIERETIGILAGKDSGLAQRLSPGKSIFLSEAQGETFVMLTKQHSSRLIQDKLFRRYDLSPRILLESDSLEVCRRIALESGACMILPNIFVDEYVRRKQGSFFPLADHDNNRHFYACYRKGDFTPVYVRDFIRMVTEYLNHTTDG